MASKNIKDKYKKKEKQHLPKYLRVIHRKKAVGPKPVVTQEPDDCENLELDFDPIGFEERFGVSI